MNLWRHRETRHMFILGALMCSIACSPKKTSGEQAKRVQSAEETAEGSSDSVKQAKKKLDKRQAEPDFRTAFRAVLTAGYKKPSPKAHLGYCRRQYQLFLEHPDQAQEFLSKKLTEGRVHEKPLALHLLGRLGLSAINAERYVLNVARDSWMVRFNRCIAKLRGASIGGAVLVPSEDEKRQCLSRLSGVRPPSDLSMACETLERLGAKKAPEILAATGMSGYFASPCVTAILGGPLDKAATLAFIASELNTNPNGSKVKAALVERRAEGVAAVIKIMEARARRGDEAAPCHLTALSKAYFERGGSLAKLTVESAKTLEMLARGQLEGEVPVVVPKALQNCAKGALSVLTGPPQPVDSRPQTAPKKSETTFPFCPEPK